MRALVAACLLVALGAGGAHAQDSAADRLRDALRKSTVELRALQDQQGALQAELDQTKQQRDALQKQVEELQAHPAAPPAPEAPKVSEDELNQLRTALKEAQAQNAALQAGLSKWQSAYNEAAGVARAKDAEAQARGREARATDQKLGFCKTANTRLIGVANDILHLYRTQDFRSLLIGSYEPLLGLKKVELENVVQDYEDKIADGRYYGNETPAAQSQPAAQSPSQPATPARPAGAKR
jgi:chromosome segregation ATPase